MRGSYIIGNTPSEGGFHKRVDYKGEAESSLSASWLTIQSSHCPYSAIPFYGLTRWYLVIVMRRYHKPSKTHRSPRECWTHRVRELLSSPQYTLLLLCKPTMNNICLFPNLFMSVAMKDYISQWNPFGERKKVFVSLLEYFGKIILRTNCFKKVSSNSVWTKILKDWGKNSYNSRILHIIALGSMSVLKRSRFLRQCIRGEEWAKKTSTNTPILRKKVLILTLKDWKLNTCICFQLNYLCMF